MRGSAGEYSHHGADADTFVADACTMGCASCGAVSWFATRAGNIAIAASSELMSALLVGCAIEDAVGICCSEEAIGWADGSMAAVGRDALQEHRPMAVAETLIQTRLRNSHAFPIESFGRLVQLRCSVSSW